MLPQEFSLLPRFQRTPSQLCSFVLQVLWCLKNKYRLSVRFVILMPGTDRWMWGYVCSLLWLCWITFMEETWKLLMMKISWIKNRKETNHPIEFFFFVLVFLFFSLRLQGHLRSRVYSNTTIQYIVFHPGCLQGYSDSYELDLHFTHRYNSSNYFHPCVMNTIFSSLLEKGHDAIFSREVLHGL